MVDIIRRAKDMVIEAGLTVTIRELTAADAMAVWGDLSKGEESGDLWGAYGDLVCRCTYVEGSMDRVWQNKLEINILPARILIPLGRAILKLSEIDVEGDLGNVSGDQSGL